METSNFTLTTWTQLAQNKFGGIPNNPRFRTCCFLTENLRTAFLKLSNQKYPNEKFIPGTLDDYLTVQHQFILPKFQNT